MIYLFLETFRDDKEGLQEDLFQESRVALVANRRNSVGIGVPPFSCNYRFMDPLAAEGAIGKALFLFSDVAGPFFDVLVRSC